MIRKDMFVCTFDDSVYSSKENARKHLDVLYTNELCKIASKLCTLDKYQDVKNFINDNLASFIRLKAIKEDMTLTNEEDEYVPTGE